MESHFHTVEVFAEMDLATDRPMHSFGENADMFKSVYQPIGESMDEDTDTVMIDEDNTEDIENTGVGTPIEAAESSEIPENDQNWLENIANSAETEPTAQHFGEDAEKEVEIVEEFPGTHFLGSLSLSPKIAAPEEATENKEPNKSLSLDEASNPTAPNPPTALPKCGTNPNLSTQLHNPYGLQFHSGQLHHEHPQLKHAATVSTISAEAEPLEFRLHITPSMNEPTSIASTPMFDSPRQLDLSIPGAGGSPRPNSPLSPSGESVDSDAAAYDRHRRRSSRLANLKSDLIASGATFRPPFTPSNSLSRAPRDWCPSPRGSVIELTGWASPDEMRSASVRPGSRGSAASGGGRAPSLPPVPKNKRYANVASRTVNRSEHKPPPSQVKITHQPIKYNVQSKVGSLANIGHVAGGGDKKIPTQKLEFKQNAAPRIEAHVDIQKLKAQLNGEGSSRSNSQLSSRNLNGGVAQPPRFRT